MAEKHQTDSGTGVISGSDHDVVQEPFTAEDEDRIVKEAVKRDNGHFALTNGQEKTLEKAAAAESQ